MKQDFQIFDEKPNLVYLDSAATSLKPRSVVQAVENALIRTANPGRGLYDLSVHATQIIERCRTKTAEFLGTDTDQIVFTHNATDGFAMLAHGLSHTLEQGDEILLSEAEHHSNILPWQQIAREKGVVIKFLPLDHTSRAISLDSLSELLTPRTKIVSLSWTSNVLGTSIQPTRVRQLLNQASSNALLILDACQTATHQAICAPDSGADFIVLSAHKLYGPSGVGILWGTVEGLTTLQPLRPGGGSVETMRSHTPAWKTGPERLEGGTPNFEGIAGWEAALDWWKSTTPESLYSHLNHMVAYARTQLSHQTLTWLTPENSHTSLLSFTIQSVHPHDIAQSLADKSICIRAGHHCAGPLFEALNQTVGSCRISFGAYTTTQDIDALAKALEEIRHDYHVEY